jgi:hypothetical protein
MINILISLISLLLGLIPLWKMFIWGRAEGTPLTSFTFMYFLIQHIAFGFGGSLIAIFDHDYSYLTIYEYLPYAAGLFRLQLINLISLYAALAGMWAIITGRRIINASLHRCPSSLRRDHLWPMTGNYAQLLRRICYVSLVFHAIIISLQWYAVYNAIPDIPRYLIQIGAKVAPATFLFMGLWWIHGRRERWIFATYILVYGFIQMATGGRAPFLYAVFMFFTGLLIASPRWFIHSRRLVVVIAVVTVPWLAVQSEDIRLLYRSREPQDLGDWARRMTMLVGSKQMGVEDSGVVAPDPETLDRTLFRFGSRINELAALDIVARTPEEFPYWGWSEPDWLMLRTGWLPAFLLTDIPKDENSGVLFLRHYGWAVDPERGHSMPVTLLADSWRRFGCAGVIVVHFFWAAFLTTISILMRRRLSIQIIVLSGALLYIFTFSYTNDMVTLVTSLPRKLVVALAYTALISAMCLLMRARWVRVSADSASK